MRAGNKAGTKIAAQIAGQGGILVGDLRRSMARDWSAAYYVATSSKLLFQFSRARERVNIRLRAFFISCCFLDFPIVLG